MKIHKFWASITLVILITNILSGVLYETKALNIQNNIEENIETNQIEDKCLNEVEYDITKNEISNELQNDVNINEITNETENNEINNIEEEQIEEIEEITQEDSTMLFSEDSEEIGVTYRTHVENIGWQDYVTNGDVAGTSGKSYRLEGININLQGVYSDLNIKYQVHVENIGWQDWKANGEMAGTEGKSYRLEGIKIILESTDDYSVMYRVHVQNIGWQDWKTDGEMAGTEGKSLRLEAIQIKIVPKVKKGIITLDTAINNSTYYSPTSIKVVGWKMSNVSNTKIKVYIDENSTPINENLITYKKRNDILSVIEGYGTEIENQNPGFEFFINTTNMSNGEHTIIIVLCTANGENIEEITTKINIDRDIHVQYKSHVQNVGWQGYVMDGAMSGTSGKSYRVEAMDINLINAPSNAKVVYRTHIQDIGWQNWKSNGELAGTSGKSLRVEAIEIKLENMNNYTIEYQVHIQDKGWTDWYIDGETAGTVGQGKRIEAIRIRITGKRKRQYNGIDVSQFNGIINWGQVKQTGIDFAFIRVGIRGYGQTGNFREDANFKQNIEAANKLGISVGIYFVTQAITPEEAIEEANWVINKIKTYDIKYPVAIDIEAPGLENPTDIPRTQNLDKNIRTRLAKLFCQTIQNAGYTPIVYTNVDWATNKLDMTQLSEYDTWIASYRSENPGYNGKYSIWQYTNKGSILGILGNVDLNYSYKKY